MGKKIRISIPVRVVEGTTPITTHYPKRWDKQTRDYMESQGIKSPEQFEDIHREAGLDKVGTVAPDIGKWSWAEKQEHVHQEREQQAEQAKREQRGE